jgi:hypothetical protein
MAKKGSSCTMKPDEEWMVEDALRTLTRAKEIRADKALMAKVRVLAQKKLEASAAIVGEAAEK